MLTFDLTAHPSMNVSERLVRARAVSRHAKAALFVVALLRWADIIALLSTENGQRLSLAAILAGILTWASFRQGPAEQLVSHNAAFDAGNDTIDRLSPLMLPCKTTHTRLFPTKHSFSYSYLYVGIPVGWRGPASSLLSVDNGNETRNSRKSRQTWFAVEAEDYLERGSHPEGLSGKLRDYLSSQGVSLESYYHAYLVTAPRFLGFSFNPVSFWYLYGKDRRLGAMILEVNNTFDERRMYFMQRSLREKDTSMNLDTFRHEWVKDFHVSPFNDRDGVYSLSALDLVNPATPDINKVDNTIVLKSQDGKPKIVARVYSTEAALRADKLTNFQALCFVARWWWVGFMTNPRILREARLLWVKKLQVFYRPEVLLTSIGRNENSDERNLESFFRVLLLRLAQKSRFDIRYIAAAGAMRARAELLGSSDGNNNVGKTVIEIRVLTPEFYRQIVRYPSILEAFEHSFFNTDEKALMLDISQPHILKELLDRSNASTGEIVEFDVRWRALRLLRWLNGGIGSVPFTELDRVVLSSPRSVDTKDYPKAAIRILLADRIAFGFTGLLQFYSTITWLACIYLGGLIVQEAIRTMCGSDRAVAAIAITTLSAVQFFDSSL